MNTANPDRGRQVIVWLFWVYFALLIVEGALRKWILPIASDPLLLARDPVALVIIGLAIILGYIPMNGFMRSLVILFVGFVALGLLQLVLGYAASAPVVVYGLRTYFLHLPLIFIMAAVLKAGDLRRLAWVTIAFGIPMVALMVWQFASPPEAWINRGVGEGLQITSAMGRVRPAGPFSFTLGPVYYLVLVSACLVAFHFAPGTTQPVLLWAGWAALVIGIAVSGSRAVVVGALPVAGATIVAAFLEPRLMKLFVRAALVLAAVTFLTGFLDVVQQGRWVMGTRWAISGGKANVLERATNTYVFAENAMLDAPLLGIGLGLGTNVGLRLSGRTELMEDEYGRVIFEAGPIMGPAYLLWRLILLAYLGFASLRVAVRGYPLPLLLTSAAALNLATGGWGLPTTLGFAVWVTGLAFASLLAAEASLRAAALNESVQPRVR